MKRTKPSKKEIEKALADLRNICSYDVWHDLNVNLEEKCFWWFKENAWLVNKIFSEKLKEEK